MIERSQGDVDSAGREVVWHGRGTPTSDGAGVRLARIIGQSALPDLDPFLLFDEFSSDEPDDYLAGFPDHPHRGFETVTYMLAGRMRHRDSRGNEGLLTAGSVQWMTAARGLVHSEMPEQEYGRMQGFQLWVNLPARDKMGEPRYQDIAPERVPIVDLGDGSHAKVLAGTLGGARGPVDSGSTAASYFDLTIAPGAPVRVPLPSAHTAFVYVHDGEVNVGAEEQAIERGGIGVLSPGDEVVLAASAQARAVLIAGKPIGEPVARYGPFVMNTRAEIEQAFADYRAGRF